MIGLVCVCYTSVAAIVDLSTSFCPDGKDLLKKLLTAEPSQRIKIADVMRHPWMTAEHPLDPLPYPNRLRVNDIDEDIVEHMTHQLRVSLRLSLSLYCHVH